MHFKLFYAILEHVFHCFILGRGGLFFNFVYVSRIEHRDIKKTLLWALATGEYLQSKD